MLEKNDCPPGMGQHLMAKKFKAINFLTGKQINYSPAIQPVHGRTFGLIFFSWLLGLI